MIQNKRGGRILLKHMKKKTYWERWVKARRFWPAHPGTQVLERQRPMELREPHTSGNSPVFIILKGMVHLNVLWMS